jgi:dihydroorotate dehydrogenase (NAD+) catalytic subunit
VAEAAQAGGASAVSLVNTLKAHATDSRTGRPWLGGGSGGLSGPAIRAIAVEQVRQVAEVAAIPVIGMGGVETGRHALELMDVGASVVAVGTASFRDPLAAERIRAELDAEIAMSPRPQLKVESNFA